MYTVHAAEKIADIAQEALPTDVQQERLGDHDLRRTVEHAWLTPKCDGTLARHDVVSYYSIILLAL